MFYSFSWEHFLFLYGPVLFQPKVAIRIRHISQNMLQSKDCQSWLGETIGSNLKSGPCYLHKLKEVMGNLLIQSLYFLLHLFVRAESVLQWACVSQKTACEISSLHPTMKVLRTNSGHQEWQEASLLCPSPFLLKITLNTSITHQTCTKPGNMCYVQCDMHL